MKKSFFEEYRKKSENDNPFLNELKKGRDVQMKENNYFNKNANCQGNQQEHVGHKHNHNHEYCNRCGECDCSCYPYRPGQEGSLIDRVICNETVNKTVEFLLPVSVGPFGLLDDFIETLSGFTNVRIEANISGIQTENTVITDTVISFGYVPADIVVSGIVGVLPLRIPIKIFFQEHVQCKGICQGDIVRETPAVLEAILDQPLLGTNGEVNLLLYKAIIQTKMTIVRQGIIKHGKVCDLNNQPVVKPVVIKSPLNMTPNTTPIP